MSQQGEAKIVVTAEDRFSRVFGQLKRDLSESQAGVSGLGGIATTAQRAFAGVAVAAASLGTAALAVRNIVNELDALNDSSDATGATVERLSALEDVARRNGGSLELVTAALLKMNQVLKEPDPDSPGARALKAIGLNAAELRKQDPADAIKSIADALAGYADDGNKARLVQELFGKSTKEVAAFLKDMAEAGQINATVTGEQAREAEKFNKQLAAFATNASNASRALVGDLLPTLNDVGARFKALQDVFGGTAKGLWEMLGTTSFTDAGEGVVHYSRQVKELQEQIAKLRAGGSVFDAINAKNREADLEKAKRLLDFYERVAAASGKFAGAGRGFVNPEVPKATVGDLAGKPSGAPKVSEAERYLEQLQRQGQALRELTVYERALEDIQSGRIDGITPALRRRILLEAQALDAVNAQNKALGEQQRGLDDLIASAERRASALDRLLESTPSGQRDRLQKDKDVVIRFAEANPENDVLQRQAAEAVQRINKELAQIDAPPIAEAVKPEWQRMLDSWADTAGQMEQAGANAMRSIDDEIDNLVQHGELNFGRLVKSILADLAKVQIKGFLAQVLGGGNSGAGGFLQIIGSLAGARAGGGPVSAGGTYLVGERGPELLSMGPNSGNIIPNHRLGGAAVTLSPVIHIDARSDQGQVAQLVMAAMGQVQAQMWEQMRVRGIA